MRTFISGVVFLTVFATAAPAEEPVVPEGTTVKLILLRQKSVQEELKVSAELKMKIDEFTEKQQDAFLKTRKLSEAEQKAKHAEMETQNEKFLKDSLSAEQHKRLDQITMQFAALHYLLKPENIRELKLSEQQVAKFKEMQAEARKALGEIINTKEGRNAKLAKLREDTREKITAVLNDEQKTKVRELAGPQFKGDIVFED
jgi:hypothetical protein